ncbi:hypothetical protein [uncultured Nostoc sp.]|uniref:hypothetical protein n=1 Tax=uncultured Nostoc sp. TaxID=340711 RepID=UPI0035CC4EDB
MMLFIAACDRAWMPPKRLPLPPIKKARMFYQMWITTGLYSDLGMDYYERKYNEQVLKNLRNKAYALGLELVPISPVTQNHPSCQIFAT